VHHLSAAAPGVALVALRIISLSEYMPDVPYSTLLLQLADRLTPTTSTLLIRPLQANFSSLIASDD